MRRVPDPVRLQLPRGIAAQLLKHARSKRPKECCALLGGDPGSGQVRSLYPARNLLASPYRYDADPRDVVRILDEIERRGEELIGIAHSHPSSPAVPSATDVREARYPVVHLLLSLSRRERPFRAWWLDGGEAREVVLTIDS